MKEERSRRSLPNRFVVDLLFSSLILLTQTHTPLYRCVRCVLAHNDSVLQITSERLSKQHRLLNDRETLSTLFLEIAVRGLKSRTCLVRVTQLEHIDRGVCVSSGRTVSRRSVHCSAGREQSFVCPFAIRRSRALRAVTLRRSTTEQKLRLDVRCDGIRLENTSIEGCLSNEFLNRAVFNRLT